MDEKKQIKDMAHDMCGNFMPNGNCAIDDEPCYLECVYGYCAEKLYCKGYRKQKFGEWESVEDDVIFKCSNCEAEVSTSWDYQNDHMFYYCPVCGAKMDGKE